eukprot:CAMPEP_0202964564 /NCGR_PEP_ID=MMETSP1396-20130829/8645_1 /ASSEMBLY_ACC=CAM_ASM_000872 /TAXON_ID= /ORGANISM="Pseudokeronopsis sp., Strain Brazil" /LENGTH=183 /DNA_ID=CAMNT_0049686759 /DNA_START=128 /DNA_END=679 /DNA_ORIENTATION=-
MAAVAPLFGIVIPGRPVITDFQVLDSTKAITLVESPQMVSELTFFLLPTTTIPPGYGAILYYSLPPFQEWSLIGSIDLSKPSGAFRTGWVANEEIQSCPVLQLGVSLEPLETIKNLELVGSGVEDRFTFAHKIAQDLFQYMASFSTGDAASQGMMVVPMNVFDRWMERFERKFRIDPNFMLKS